MKFIQILASATLALSLSTAVYADDRQSKGTAQYTGLDLTIYHLEGRRSERLVWLCEELGIPYDLKYKMGDLRGSMQTIRALNPGMPVAPTVEIEGQIMVESGAIMEYILDKYTDGKLMPAMDSPNYKYYLQWMHFAEGSFASRVISDFVKNRIRMENKLPKPDIKPGQPRLVDTPKVLTFLDDFLGENAYFGGDVFSAADIMMLFPTNLAQAWYVADLTPYKNLLAWREKVQARPAYIKTMEKARPNGIPPLK
ncbi:glutathione S-transferase family protein [uncultured Paraglaciecola sp.]|uniref:glutathione S-transferase family protein n=1 Tax=uncultured Paraglaciecola sp. TaxID=1765024 RepID=UPI002630117F|nr:glutathione S-transferase family protein [uncultured Paraglaciecola sp.]